MTKTLAVDDEEGKQKWETLNRPLTALARSTGPKPESERANTPRVESVDRSNAGQSQCRARALVSQPETSSVLNQVRFPIAA